MDFRFNETQLLFAETTKEMLLRECTSSNLKEMILKEQGTIPNLWDNLSSLGVLGMTGPQNLGGLGMSDIDHVLIMEELGRFICPEIVLEHTAIGIPLLSKYGNESIQSELLSALLSGEQKVTTGLGNSYVLAADSADYLVMQNADELHLIERKDALLMFQKSIDQTRRLFSVEWEPSSKSLIVKSSKAIEEGLQSASTAAAAQCLGIATHLLTQTIDYVKEREQFGKPVGVNQAVKHQLADTGKAIEFARPMVHRAAWAISNNSNESSAAVAMAKYLSSKAVDLSCRTALQCHGAIAYTVEYDLQLWLKRGWALSASWGDQNSQRNSIAKILNL